MSSFLYNTTLGGRGVGQGLPMNAGGDLYERHPEIAYPKVFTPFVDSASHTYPTNRYLPLPSASITMELPPYIDNPKADGTRTFTRTQYFTTKRGAPVAAVSKRADAIGYFEDGGTVTGIRTNDPAEYAGSGSITAYEKNGASITPAAFDALSEGDKVGYRGVFTADTDTNDRIPTGGVSTTAQMREAIYGGTYVTEVEADAAEFYRGQAQDSDGFFHHATGGFDFVEFFNARDYAAKVTLPKKSGSRPVRVQALSTADVSLANIANWKNSAVMFYGSNPTVGFAHTDIEQVTNLQYHGFSTGGDLHSPFRKGMHYVPFVDIAALNALIASKAPNATAKVTDTSLGLSGLKVGLTGASLEQKLLYSLLTSEDAGYANLVYNFGAPFLTATQMPDIGDRIVPDLFGNFVLFGSGIVNDDATADVDGDENAFNLAQGDIDANANGSMEVNNRHICGEVTRVIDIPYRSNIFLEINPMFTHRLGSDKLFSRGYTRARGAETAGVESLLFDFAVLLLGGADATYFGGFTTEWDGRAVDIAHVVHDLVVRGVIGIVETASDAFMR